MSYIAYNPVKKGLVEDIMDYRWYYLCENIKKAGWKPAPRGIINYTVWSDVFICPECTGEVVFWNAAVDKEKGIVRDEFPCPHCNAKLTKRTMERAWITKFDKAINQTIKQARQLPVLINYSVELASGQPVNQLNFNHSSRQDAGSTAKMKRFEKAPDVFDLTLIEKIENSDIPYWFPTYRMPEGDESRRNDDIGITHVHHFYTKRNLWVLGALYDKAFKSRYKLSIFFIQYAALGFSKISRYVPTHFSQVNQYLSGTLYIGSQQVEVSPDYILTGKLQRLIKHEAPRFGKIKVASIGCCDSSVFPISHESFDYIFTDPPFGGNLMYSELNFLWEAWLKVFTNNKPEAIENDTQGKGLAEYQHLMTECFKEYFRVLKPGRWMTVEFHNSKNSVWNAIQEALQHAGFVIADVRTLDKKQGTFKQVTSRGAVKQDLIISAYKPNGGLEERFKLKAGTEEGAWDFVRTHLRQLPVFVQSKDGRAEAIAERMNYLLFDRMVAFHVQRGITVPISAAEFYAGLEQRFPSRDGMYFLPEQAAEYDRKRMTVKEVLQLQLLVTDEASAIQWLKQQLTRKPQTFQEIHPQFMKEIGGWQKYEKPLELLEMLEQNFLRYDGKDEVPAQIHSYLSTNFKELRNLPKDDPSLRDKAKDRWYVPDPNKAQDLEKLREKALLKDFEEYRSFTGRKLKSFRIEAVRAGFKRAWQERDYQTIISVSKKIPENVLQEDQKLLMWYDQAVTRTGLD
ncbi:MAG: site-specific DNA-methyltransferase [Candidatus Brocadia sp.]